MAKRVLGVTIGQCIHVAGVLNFLRLAEQCGHETQFLGAAVHIADIVTAIRQRKPHMLAVGYRLTPEVAQRVISELGQALQNAGIHGLELAFGGTPPVAEVARRSGLFAAVFGGDEEPDEVVSYLRGIPLNAAETRHPGTLVERVAVRAPMPILRHHFGLPSLEDTVRGAHELAMAGVLDVLSIGPDQNAQECFFRPGEMKPSQDGAGGVPLRRSADLTALYDATRCGNFPLLRVYAGTRDLLQWGEMAQQTIHNAWAAIPLFWYSILDGRSQRPVREAIAENQQAIRWHAQRGIPVEVNDPHHWSLRDAPDVIAVADAFLSAYNAKAMGVKNYVAQFMWNTPPSTSPAMDLAKMLAKWDLISTLEDGDFSVIRECRCGLASLSAKPDVAKGQLAASTMLSLALKPHIIHVVGFCEGDHAATPADIIESCGIVRGVLRNAASGLPNMAADPVVQDRRAELVREAGILLDAIRRLGSHMADPLSDPAILARAIHLGIMDAPHLAGNAEGRGAVRVSMQDGKCVAVDVDGKPMGEEQRLAELMEKEEAEKREAAG